MSEFAMEPLVRNAWYLAAWAHELDDGPIARKIMGEDLVMFRAATGSRRRSRTGAATGA